MSDEPTEFDKIANEINSRIEEIFAKYPIELASCMFAIKGSDHVIVADKGHHYDIAALLSNILRDRQDRIRAETGLS